MQNDTVSFFVLSIFTGNSFALDGLGNDGSGLVSWLRQSFAQLLYAVAVHNDGVPPEDTQPEGITLTLQSYST